VALAPDFATTGTIYLSWAEAGTNDTRGAAVARAKLVTDGGSGWKDCG
jgi:glucose/arabinose dehydrogenase